jgi:hypothetical protein
MTPALLLLLGADPLLLLLGTLPLLLLLGAPPSPQGRGFRGAQALLPEGTRLSRSHRVPLLLGTLAAGASSSSS